MAACSKPKTFLVRSLLKNISGRASVIDLEGSATLNTTVNVTFSGGATGVLTLNHSDHYAGKVAGFAFGDSIDVKDIAFAAGKDFYDPTTHLLNLSDGTHAATIQLLGSYTASDFTFQSDGHGGTQIAGSEIINGNPLTAQDDAYVTLQGNSLPIAASSGVLFNDDTVSPAIASLVTGPAHGALQLTFDGGFSYTPTPGFTGIDAFTYSGGAQSSDATALIYVVPVISGALNLLALTPDEQIAATYTAFLGRGADAAGFKFWENAFATESQTESPAKLIAGITSSFASSDEAKALYPLLANPTGASGSQITGFVNDVYENLFNRAADTGGLTFWSGLTKAEIAAGNFDGAIVVQIMSGAQGQDITTLISKVAVSLAYVQDQEHNGTQLAGVNDLAVATALIHAVTSDPQTVLIGIAQAHALDLAHT